MQMRVHKYELTDERMVLELPLVATVLTVAKQGNTPCLWALVDPDADTRERRFIVWPTGRDLPTVNGRKHVYVGTVHGVDGWIVLHVFEEVKA